MALWKHRHSFFLRRRCFDSFHLSRFYFANNQISLPDLHYSSLPSRHDKICNGRKRPGNRTRLQQLSLDLQAFGPLSPHWHWQFRPTFSRLLHLIHTIFHAHTDLYIATLSSLPHSSICKRQVPSTSAISLCLIETALSSCSPRAVISADPAYLLERLKCHPAAGAYHWFTLGPRPQAY